MDSKAFTYLSLVLAGGAQEGVLQGVTHGGELHEGRVHSAQQAENGRLSVGGGSGLAFDGDLCDTRGGLLQRLHPAHARQGEQRGQQFLLAALEIFHFVQN